MFLFVHSFLVCSRYGKFDEEESVEQEMRGKDRSKERKSYDNNKEREWERVNPGW